MKWILEFGTTYIRQWFRNRMMTRKFTAVQQYKIDNQAEEKRLLPHTCILIVLSVIYIIQKIASIFYNFASYCLILLASSCNYETWHSYTLPKQDPKKHNSSNTSLEFWDVSFFSPEVSTFCYNKKYAIDCILMHIFNFLKPFWVFKGCFNKQGSNFDDVSKTGFSRSS